MVRPDLRPHNRHSLGSTVTLIEATEAVVAEAMAAVATPMESSLAADPKLVVDPTADPCLVPCCVSTAGQRAARSSS